MSPSPAALGEHPAPNAGCVELEVVEALTGGGLSPPSLLSHTVFIFRFFLKGCAFLSRLTVRRECVH